MRQAGRSEHGRLRVVGCTPSSPPWGGESPKGVCRSQYRGVSVPFPGPWTWPAAGVHLTPPCAQSFQTTDRGVGTRASQWQRPGWGGRGGHGVSFRKGWW